MCMQADVEDLGELDDIKHPAKRPNLGLSTMRAGLSQLQQS